MAINATCTKMPSPWQGVSNDECVLHGYVIVGHYQCAKQPDDAEHAARIGTPPRAAFTVQRRNRPSCGPPSWARTCLVDAAAAARRVPAQIHCRVLRLVLTRVTDTD
eukprot:scpid108447/ scgid10074/ 